MVLGGLLALAGTNLGNRNRVGLLIGEQGAGVARCTGRLAVEQRGASERILIQRLIDAIDPALAVPNLSDDEIADLVAFLGALTDPAASDLEHLIPDHVPSGLPVDR